MDKSLMHLVRKIRPRHNQILHLGEKKKKEKEKKKGSTILKKFQCNFRYHAIHKNTRQQRKKVRMRNSIISLHSYLGSLCGHLDTTVLLSIWDKRSQRNRRSEVKKTQLMTKTRVKKEKGR